MGGDLSSCNITHDLWCEFWSHAHERDIEVMKVKSHCGARDLTEGRIQVEQLRGNMLADALAGLAAEKGQPKCCSCSVWQGR